VSLEPADIDAIAQRVLALLQDQVAEAPVRFVDAGTLAKALGVDRSWVYAHAQELQAVRLGGAHGRLRFDLDLVRRGLQAEPVTPTPRRRRPRTKVMQISTELLPIDP
jgi:hypothetical protein